MARLMAEDHEDLVGRHLLDSCVPHHDALGVAEAFHVRVHGGELSAGLHQEHALGRDIHVALFNYLFQLRDEGGIGLGKRLIVKEDRLNIGRDEDAEQGDGDGECPEE
jgi:hypothetical protein